MARAKRIIRAVIIATLLFSGFVVTGAAEERRALEDRQPSASLLNRNGIDPVIAQEHRR